MPKLSVIVPVYNNIDYFNTCIESIINQTFKDIEIIIVSDGPNSVHQLCDDWAKKDSRIKVLKDIKLGLGGARNAALNIAKGQYISFVDADDFLEPDAYKKLIDVYENNPKADLVVFDTKLVDKCKKTLSRDKEADYIKLKYSGLIAINREQIFQTNVHAWNKLWKKEIIDKYNIKFPQKVCLEDFPFYFKYVFAIKNVFYLNEQLYSYLRYDTSLMSETYSQKRFEQNKIHIASCEFLYNELKKDNLFKQNEALFIELFDRWVSIAIFHSKKKDIEKIKKLAYDTIIKLNLDIKQSPSLKKLKKRYEKFFMLRLLEDHVFSLTNEDDYKILTFLGVKTKFKRKNKEKV